MHFKLAIPFVLLLVVMIWVGTAPSSQPATAAPGDKLSYALSVMVTTPGAPGQSAPAVVANGVQAGLSPTGGGSLQADASGRVLVIIRLTNTSPNTLNALNAAGAAVVSVQAQFRSVSAYVPLAQLTSVAALNEVENIREALRAGTDSEDMPKVQAPAAPAFACGTPSGNAISQGNAQLNVDAARTTFGVNGAGVKIGVESDSYAAATLPVTTAATDITTDDLPGPGNPCGFTTANQILQDCPLFAGCVDEGRAMMQIIHDLVPGSTMAFGSPNNETDFATLLTQMQAGGAKVFSDDLNFFEDPFFQEGPIGVAAGNARAAGMMSFTSAGNTNSAIGGVNWNGYESNAYRPTACPAAIPAGHADCHNFGTLGVPDATYGLTMPAGLNVRPILQWAEPRFGVTTDLDFYLLNAAGTTVLRTSASANTGGGGTQLPFEFWSFIPGASTPGQIVVARRTGFAGTPRLKIIFFRSGGISNVEYTVPSPGDSVGHNILGHHCSQNFMSIAATDGATAGTTLENYSSFGPCTFYFGPVVGAVPAAPLGPLVVAKPEVVASDCVATTFFLPPPGPPYLFCGTSASSPHAAAVAALLMSFKPAATIAQVQNAILTTAVPMAGGPDRVGAGRINALAAMNALAAVGATGPTATKAFAPASLAVGADSTMTITLTNPNAAVVTAVAFTDTFPAGLVISPTPALTNTCGGTATANAGTSTLSLGGGTIAANGSCALTVAVRSAAAGSYLNTTGAIASSVGAGTAGSATLTVTAAGGGGGNAPAAPTPTSTPTPPPPPPPVVLGVPQVFQNPYAIQGILGGIGNGTRNATPVPGSAQSQRSPTLANDQFGRAAAGDPPVLRPPNTGEAGLKPVETVDDPRD